MQITKFLKHQSKLLVLALGEEADERVNQRCFRYTLALGEFGNDGVYRFEGGDGGPLAAAVDVEVVIGVFQVVYHEVFRRDSIITQLVGDAFALTDGCSRCHRHSKNLEGRCMKKCLFG